MANAGCQLELQRLKRNHKPPALLQQQRDSSGGGRQQSLQEVAGGAGGSLVLAPCSYTASPRITAGHSHSSTRKSWETLMRQYGSSICASNTTKVELAMIQSCQVAEPRSRHEYCQIVTVSGVTSPVTRRTSHTSHTASHMSRVLSHPPI